MKPNVLILLLIFAIIGTAKALPPIKYTSRPPKSVAVTTVDSPPQIDGILEEEIWSQAQSFDDFYRCKSTEPSQGKTQISALQHGESLYLGIRCTEPAEVISGT